MSAENGTTTASLLRHSPFMSMFGRKKRINGTKSAEDIKGVASALTANDRTTTTMNGSAKPTQNGGDFVAGDTFIDSDHYDSTHRGQHQLNSNLHQSAGNQDCFAAVDEPYNNTCPQYSQYPQQSASSSPSTFADKIRHHKNSRSKLHSRDSKSEARPGSVPAESSTLPNLAAVSAGKKDLADRNQLRRQQKAFSADAVYSLEPLYLMEALETLAEDQPLVARSIPKHARVDTSGFAKRSLDNCLFDSTVYDNMLCDSLKACQMLQNHLDECIETVRAKSPEGLQRNGRLRENGQDEEESEATNNTNSQRTVIESPQIRGHHPNRISTLTTDSTVSSIEFDMRAGAMHPNEAECRKLKSLVQYQC